MEKKISFNGPTIGRGLNFDFTTTTEFVDNSIPLNAKNISLKINDSKLLYIDDGINHISEDNVDQLLTFGKKPANVGYNDNTGVGCYGMGMNATCSSISKDGLYQFEAWSDDDVKTLVSININTTSVNVQTVDTLPHLTHKGFCIYIDNTNEVKVTDISNIIERFTFRYSKHVNEGLKITVNGRKILFEDPQYTDLVTHYDSFNNNTGTKLTKSETVVEEYNGKTYTFKLTATMPVRALLHESTKFHCYDHGKIANKYSGFAYVVNGIRITDYSTIFKGNSEQYIANTLRCDVEFDSDAANIIVKGAANKTKPEIDLSPFPKLLTTMSSFISWASQVRGAFDDEKKKEFSENNINEEINIGKYTIDIVDTGKKQGECCYVDSNNKIVINEKSITFKNGIDPKTAVHFIYFYYKSLIHDNNEFVNYFRSTISEVKKNFK